MKLTELVTHMPNGMIPVDELQKITQFVLIALDHIHRQDVIHTGINYFLGGNIQALTSSQISA
jgi:hypothetical protein